MLSATSISGCCQSVARKSAGRLQTKAFCSNPVKISRKCTSRTLQAGPSIRWFGVVGPHQTPQHICRAAEEGSVPKTSVDTPTPTGSNSPQNSNLIASVGLGAVYLGLLGYAIFLAPDQTPARDVYFLEKCLNLITDAYQLPAVWWSVFNIMGVYPILYASLIIPTGRSANKIPAWPFIAGSFVGGVFALLPYFILWQPQVQPSPAQEGEQSVSNTILDTALPVILLAAAVGLWVNALQAGPAGWNEFFRLFDESRLTHITVIDFMCLTVLAPFWMSNDATVRGWEPRDKVLPVLSLLPVVGPALYLVLRPKKY